MTNSNDKWIKLDDYYITTNNLISYSDMDINIYVKFSGDTHTIAYGRGGMVQFFMSNIKNPLKNIYNNGTSKSIFKKDALNY